MYTTLHSPEFDFRSDALPRARIGFVLPEENRTFESDIRAIELEGVDWSFSRMLPVTKTDHPLDRDLDQALMHVHRASVALNSDKDLDVAFFAAGCLSAVVGNEHILKSLSASSENTMVSSVYTATKRAVRAIQAKHIAIATGYDPKTNDLIASTFAAMGISVVSINGTPKTDEFNFNHKSPREIRNFALSLDRADADAIVISSTTLRAMEVIDELEQMAGKPVICSNQIALWDSLRCAGISVRIPGYGSLLQNC